MASAVEGDLVEARCVLVNDFPGDFGDDETLPPPERSSMPPPPKRKRVSITAAIRAEAIVHSHRQSKRRRSRLGVRIVGVDDAL